MNEMFEAMRKSYNGAFKLMHLLKIVGTGAGREYGISEKIAQDRLGLQSNVFAMPCRMILSSTQDRLGLTIFSSSLW